jgi:prepilin-type N-terminal cleavage/methylation domain-containing protein/prepilin-type processing-associated H-X9-DG protein
MIPLRSRRGFTLIELLVVIAIIGVLVGLLLAAVQQVRGAAMRAQCQNNLKQIGLALHDYHDVHGSFPPALVEDMADPYPYFSWMARILPFLEQDTLWRQMQSEWPLYKRGDITRLIANEMVPKVYLCPADGRNLTKPADGYQEAEARTDYAGVNGTNLYTRDGIFCSGSAVRLTDVTDGTSNTLMVGERPPSEPLGDTPFGFWAYDLGQGGGSVGNVLGAAELNPSGIWFTECPYGPYAYGRGDYRNECDMLHFWSFHTGGAHFLFADGSVHFLSYAAGAPVLPALATRSGGEVVSGDW